MSVRRQASIVAAALAVAASLTVPAAAQLPRRQPTPNDTLRTPIVEADGRVTFRIYAPRASEVAIVGDWITQGRGQGGALTKNAQGVWSITVGPLVPDWYSYSFIVDSVRTADPKSGLIKQGISSVESMVFVPGEAAAYETPQAVPHGQVRIVYYESKTLGVPRSMHVYTPPGYDQGKARYPVFYLLHGGGDDDSGWSTIGKANVILDNLIAAGKARAMIVVMPNGSMPRPAAGAPAGPGAMASYAARFRDELLNDIKPLVEKSFRVLTGPQNTAIAGLSMGGGQTLAVAPGNLDKFGYVGVWSMGVSPDTAATARFKQDNAAFLQAERTNSQARLISVSVGSTDFLIASARNLVDVLKAAGIRHEFHESEGGHTWINWRHYLNDFAQQLFR